MPFVWRDGSEGHDVQLIDREICKLIEYHVHTSHCSTKVKVVLVGSVNPLRQTRRPSRRRHREAPHGTVISNSVMLGPVRACKGPCFANFEVQQARTYDPMSFPMRERESVSQLSEVFFFRVFEPPSINQ